MYIDALSLMKYLGKSELALLVAGKLGTSIDDELLMATIKGDDRASYQRERVEKADEALSLIDNTITTVANTVNGYLAQRHNLPLSIEVVEKSPLPLICFKLVRFELSLKPSEQLQRDKSDAMTQLRDIAKGLITMGPADPKPTTSSVVNVARIKTPSLTDGFGR